jgi:hypothetical protein
MGGMEPATVLDHFPHGLRTPALARSPPDQPALVRWARGGRATRPGLAGWGGRPGDPAGGGGQVSRLAAH